MGIWLALPILTTAVVGVVSVDSQRAQHHRLAQSEQQIALGKLQPDLLDPWQQEDLDNRHGCAEKLRGGGGRSSSSNNHRKAMEDKGATTTAAFAEKVEPDLSVNSNRMGEEEEKEMEAEDRRPLVDHEYTGWSPELSAGRGGADGSGARRVVSGVAAPAGGVLENTLSVHAEIKGDILVRDLSL